MLVFTNVLEFKIPVLSLLPAVFLEVPPQNINGERLYEREEASVQLVSSLLSGGGNKETPVCDDSFGGGKTSLIFKFRAVLDVMLEEGRWTAPTNYHLLRDAVYIHVPFGTYGKRGSSAEDCVCTVLNALRYALISSCRSSAAALPATSIDAFCEQLALCNPERTRFLLHFDDVGCFESFGNEVGISMIYTMWFIGDKLREQGHYFTMTGRSALLRVVGTGVLDCEAFKSPDRTKVVRLSPLNLDSVQKLLTEFQLPPNLVEQAHVVHALTGGIPRAVYSVAKYLSMNRARINSVKEVLPGILDALDQTCRTTLSPNDIGIFKTCVEMAWAGLYFTDNMSLSGEAITSVIARLGIFRGQDVVKPGGVVHFQLVVPPFVALTHLSSVRSLFAIKEQDEKGSRLEAGARRVLHLRFRWGPCANWDAVGLPSLTSANVPFPTVPLHYSYAFPKIAKKNPWREADVVAFMDASHKSPNDDVSDTRIEFALAALPCIFSKMQEGQWYQSLPKAGCADAHIKCAPRVVVDFQFKNTSGGMDESNARKEAVKSVAEGFAVYLVIVCVAGNGTLEDKVFEDKAEFPGVTVIVLSKASVQYFLGENLVKTYSSATALVDSKVRLGVSPMKQGSGLKDIVNDMSILQLSCHK
jgi:hypothetical protein